MIKGGTYSTSLDIQHNLKTAASPTNLVRRQQFKVLFYF